MSCLVVIMPHYVNLILPYSSRVDQESSKIPGGQSSQQHQTDLNPIFMVCTTTTFFFSFLMLWLGKYSHFSIKHKVGGKTFGFYLFCSTGNEPRQGKVRQIGNPVLHHLKKMIHSGSWACPNNFKVCLIICTIY